jgi:hypothetical protein
MQMGLTQLRLNAKMQQNEYSNVECILLVDTI